MSWIQRLSPKAKLLLSFLFVCSMLSAVSITALVKMRVINFTVQNMYENQLLPISALGTARAIQIDICRQVQRAVLATDKETVDECQRDLDGLNSDFAKFYDEVVVPQATTTEEAAMVVKIKAAFKEYLAQAASVFKLRRSDQAEEAKAEVVELFAKSKEIVSLLDDEIKLNERFAEEGLKTSNAAYNLSFWLVSSLITVGTIIGLTIGWFIASWITGVLNHISAMSAENDRRAEADRATALEVEKKVALVLEVVNQVAAGNLDISVRDLGTDAIGQVAKALNSAVASMRGSLMQVASVSETVSSAADQMSSASRQIAQGAQSQASSLEETASSLEEITATIKQNSDNAQQARQLANGSRDVAERGGAVVNDAVLAMEEINNSSKRIADIITTIDEIAFQTNLLALNAAVEAARAGEQGRGFAVVAAEVRNLAQRSASAAKEIKVLIQDSVARVQNGTELVNKSGQTLSDIVTSVKRVTDIVCEIAAASKEQLSGVEQVNKAVSQMDRVTQGNAAQTEEMSGTSDMLLAHARQLADSVARFRLGQRRDFQMTSHGKTAALDSHNSKSDNPTNIPIAPIVYAAGAEQLTAMEF